MLNAMIPKATMMLKKRRTWVNSKTLDWGWGFRGAELEFTYDIGWSESLMIISKFHPHIRISRCDGRVIALKNREY